LNIHDHKFSFDASTVIFHLWHSQIPLKIKEELLNFSASNLVTFEVSWLEPPLLFEFGDIILKSVKHIIVWKIVKIELLKDNKDEKVDHDVLLDYHKDYVESKGPDGTAVYTRDAVSVGVHAVKHYHGPVLSRWKPQHHYKRVGKRREIHVVVYLFSLSDFSEEKDTENWEDKVDESQESKSVDHWGHRESNCLDQGLESFILIEQSE